VTADDSAASGTMEPCISYDAESGEAQIDAACFFRLLMTRYRDLAFYEDVSHVLRVTQRAGEDPQCVETEIGCEIENGRLRVQTPASQALGLFGLNGLFRSSPEMKRAALDYNLWLAPHLLPRFAEDVEISTPSERSQYTPMSAEPVTIDDKPMILLAVEQAVDEQTKAQARLDLYVDPDSMLVERAEHRQTLPDGAEYQTTVEITARTARTADELAGSDDERRTDTESERSEDVERDDAIDAPPPPPVSQSITPPNVTD
jgi:hypothetical protein